MNSDLIDNILEKYSRFGILQFRYEKASSYRYAKFIQFKNNQVVRVFGACDEDSQIALEKAIKLVKMEFDNE